MPLRVNSSAYVFKSRATVILIVVPAPGAALA